ncbi:MAG TPA: triose-phosphate isomerase, partial [Candidatus Nanoarchaeia archaeon]|nr:triose-phosphate isomerase [Candidatus Nanoarchaeia archaeon]
AKRERAFVQSQLSTAFDTLSAAQATKVIIAYEPIWAIGTGKTATPKQAQEMHVMIREWCSKRYRSEIAAEMRIIYGGSANADNCRDLLMQPDVDGLLPGGASLDPAVFATMAEIAESVAKKKA